MEGNQADSRTFKELWQTITAWKFFKLALSVVFILLALSPVDFVPEQFVPIWWVGIFDDIAYLVFACYNAYHFTVEYLSQSEAGLESFEPLGGEEDDAENTKPLVVRRGNN